MYKIYNTLLRERIQPTLDMIPRPNQDGFRNNRSTVGQILPVRRIIEGVKEKNVEASLRQATSFRLNTQSKNGTNS